MSQLFCTNAKVLVRAFGNEPVEMVCRSYANHRLDVARPGSSESLNIPESMAVPFDAGLKQKIVAAIQKGGPPAAERLWRAAS